jgi:periplasmic protein TonB
VDIAGKLPHKRSYDPLGLAVLGALAFHALLILGVSFDIQRKNPPAPERTLDITLVTPPNKPVEVEKPDMLAQATQQGGGEELVKQRASSPLGNPLATPKKQPAPELKRAGALQPEAQKRPQVVTRKQAEVKQVVRPLTPTVQTTPRPDLSQLLSSTQQEIDRLTAEIDRRNRASSSRERHKAINASTQEYKYASYMEAWRKKVERIGNLNYPDEAKRNKLYGSLLLHVSVRADGSIERIRLVKSSGHKILDDAAMRIVRLAAPFAPFPANIRKEVDVLDITRTWQFRSGNQLFSSH